METVPSHPSRTSRRTPRPSLPNTSANGPARSSSVYGVPPASAAYTQRPATFIVSMARLRLVTLATRTCSLAPALALTAAAVTPSGPVLRDDDPAGPCPVRGPQDGPEVARVGDAVEDEYQRLGRGEDLLQSGVRIRLDAGHDALVNSAPGQLLYPLSG